jgi:hypothetical protein
MTHRITIEICPEKEPEAVFTCYEPDTAWCRQNVVGPSEERPENRLDCWFTVLASGFSPWGRGGTYDGLPAELRSAEIEFTKIDGPEDLCFWHYKGDPGGHENLLDGDPLSEGKREKHA